MCRPAVRRAPLHHHAGHRRGAAAAGTSWLHHRRRHSAAYPGRHDHLGANGQTAIIDGTEIRVRRPAVGRRDRDEFISGKTRRNAVRSMILTDAGRRILFAGAVLPASCADIAQPCQLGLTRLLVDAPFREVLANAGCQGLGASTGGHVGTPPHRKSKKGVPTWWKETHASQRKAHSSGHIRVEHGITHLRNWRALARRHGRREHLSDMVQALPCSQRSRSSNRRSGQHARGAGPRGQATAESPRLAQR
ncbi:transposase family protein [Streptomyces sp. NPDC020377]|uniref:transposase family protein n=1 Tax=Streptomyces sp. NPDC020377 TaxID=3365070 RepID=UPI00379DDF41